MNSKSFKQGDTAVIAAVFGDDPVRIAAHVAALHHQLQTDIQVDFYLVELIFGGESRYPKEILSKVRHILVRGTDANRDLFQKESLFNIAWRAALKGHKYDYFVFVDADVYCERPDWFRQIRAKLREAPCRAVQGFQFVRDSVDPDLQYVSLGANYLLERSTDLYMNPGLCWGLHRELLLAGNGFNELMCPCGDSMFVAEYLNTPEVAYDSHLYEFRFFRELYRDLPFRAALDFVPLDLVHHHHGYVADRCYYGMFYAVDSLSPMNTWLRTDESGLHAWIDPGGIERTLLRQQSRMKSPAAVDELLKELGLQRPGRLAPLDEFSPRRKPLFHIPGEAKSTALGLRQETPPSTDGIGDRLPLFNPQRLYLSTFPFSWCQNAKSDALNRVPTAMRDGCPRLVWESLPGAAWMSCSLAVEVNWRSRDLTRHRWVHFTIMTTGDRLPAVSVALVSAAPDGTTTDSEDVRVETDLLLGTRQSCTIPLHRFWTNSIDPHRIRQLRFVALFLDSASVKGRLVRWLRRGKTWTEKKRCVGFAGSGRFIELSQVYID